MASNFMRDISPSHPWASRNPKFLLSLGCALALLLLTWTDTPQNVLANVPEATPNDEPLATLVQDNSMVSITAAPSGIATSIHPPMQFEPNLGQTDPQVQFMARGVGYTIFLTPTEAILVLPSDEPQPDGDSREADSSARSKQVVHLQVLEANPTPSIRGIDETPTTINRLIGTDPNQWQTHVPVYAQVRYDAIYPGIDLLYYGNQEQLEYDFIVHPGADPSRITLGIQGADHATLEEDGHLLLSLPSGVLRLKKPLLTQTVAGKKTNVHGSFLLLKRNPADTTTPPIQIAFAVGSYDQTLPLIIDPLVNYASTFGGIGHDSGEAIAIDNDGHGYIVGVTDSFTFPVTADAFQHSAIGSDRDVFVTKFDTETSEILFSTYIGGEGDDRATGVAVDAKGIPYVTGRTTSLTFPTQDPIQETLKGPSDAFVLKLAADGSSLLYSTYLGGNGPDHANAIVVDEQGQAALTGTTTSPDFPIINASDTSLGHGEVVPLSDVFVTTLDAQGVELQFSTFLGGTGADVGHSLTFDAEGGIYLTGETTEGSGFPVTTEAFQPTYGGGTTDAFIVKLNPSRTGPTALEYVSYLGGSGEEVGLDLLVDAQLQTFITGWTTGQGQASAVVTPSRSPAPNTPVNTWGRRNNPPTAENPARSFLNLRRDLRQQQTPTPDPAIPLTPSAPLPQFPVTPNAYDVTFNGGKDAFMAQVNVAGSGPSALVYATYVGGSQSETGTAIGIDSLGRLCIAGTTNSPDYPVNNPLANQDTLSGGTDGFVTKFQADPTALLFSSFLGGSGNETLTAMRLDANDLAYLTGQTRSTDFPLLTPLDDTSQTGEPQAFVVKLQDPVDITATLIPTDMYLHLGDDYTWTVEWANAGPDPATGVQVAFEFAQSGSTPSLQFKSLQNLTGPSSIITNSCSGSAQSEPGGILTCDVSDVPPTGAISVAQIMFTPVTEDDYSISATMSSLEVDTNPVNNGNTVTGSIGTRPRFPQSLTVNFFGNGTGSVTGTPGPSNPTFTISDSSTLEYPPPSIPTITLVATPTDLGNNASTFNEWSGECTTITENQCTVRLTADRTVNALFERVNQAPSVNAGPDQSITLPADATLSGIVTDDGLPAPPTLMTTWSEVSGPGTVTFADATEVDTTAAFSAPGTYVLRLTADDSELSDSDTITITVVPIQRTLTITKTENGTVTGDGGLDCGSDCTETVNDGTSLTLTATPSINFTFTGWTVSGSPAATCPGTGTCRVTLDTNRTVTANFRVVQRTLTITKTGSGTVTGAGINCGTDCSVDVDIDTSITLTATPTTNSTFTGWTVTGSPSATCPGTDTCTVTLDVNRTITATFAIIQRTLTITKTGSGTGTVTGSGINCGNNCTETVDSGTQFTLTAAPNPSFFFTGWAVSGSPTATCPGTGTCTIILDTNRAVTATFAANQPPVVDAGQPQVINLPAGSRLPVDVSLKGTVTDDGLPPPASLTNLWRLVTGPAVISDIVNNAAPTVSFPAIGSYILELSATDGALPHTDTVTITINDPSAAQVLIPSVVGQTETAAITALTTVGLTRGTITKELNALVPSGSVIRQAPLGGEFANPGTPVNLVISSGTELLITIPSDGTDASPGNGICETSPGNGACSLRAAIQEANAFPGQQTLTLTPEIYPLTIAGANEDTSRTGDLDITDDVIIESSTGNPNDVIITGNALDRVFDLPPASSPSVTLRGLTIQEGIIEGSTGGGLRNAQGTLTLENSVLRANQSNGSGGGLSHLGGTLTLRNTQVTNNTSEGLGGGLHAQNGSVTIVGNTSFTRNTANFGGGLSTGGADVTLKNVRIENNTAVGGGGGIYKFLSPGDLLGSIQAPRVALSNTTVRNNTINDCEGYLINAGNNTFGSTARCTLLAP